MKYANLSFLAFCFLLSACNNEFGTETERSSQSEKETSNLVLEQGSAFNIPKGIYQTVRVELWPLYQNPQGSTTSEGKNLAADSSFGVFNENLQASGLDTKQCYRIWHGLTLHCILNESQRQTVADFSNVVSIGPLENPCPEIINH